jgi:hypothetical protein
MTSSNPIDNEWGLALSRYLAVAKHYRPNELLGNLSKTPAKGSSLDVMEEFLAQTNRFTSISALVDVLSLAQTPENLHQFNNTRIIPACVRLLRRYARDHNVSWGFIGCVNTRKPTSASVEIV